MRLESELLDEHILKISLDGRLDIDGTQAIDMPFTALAATKKAAVLVDLSQVTFLTSIGIRTLLTCAKAASARGGKMRKISDDGNGMWRKKPMRRSGRARRSIAGTSIRWKSCTKTRTPGRATSSTASVKRSFTAR